LFVVHRFLSPWWRRRQVPPKRRFLQEPHGVTTQKTPFFGVLIHPQKFLITSKLTSVFHLKVGSMTEDCSTIAGRVALSADRQYLAGYWVRHWSSGCGYWSNPRPGIRNVTSWRMRRHAERTHDPTTELGTLRLSTVLHSAWLYLTADKNIYHLIKQLTQSPFYVNVKLLRK
jgi:hypothetical protein